MDLKAEDETPTVRLVPAVASPHCISSMTFHSITWYQSAALFILSLTPEQQQWQTLFPAASHHHWTPLWIKFAINQLLKSSVGLLLPVMCTHAHAHTRGRWLIFTKKRGMREEEGVQREERDEGERTNTLEEEGLFWARIEKWSSSGQEYHFIQFVINFWWRTNVRLKAKLHLRHNFCFLCEICLFTQVCLLTSICNWKVSAVSCSGLFSSWQEQFEISAQIRLVYGMQDGQQERGIDDVPTWSSKEWSGVFFLLLCSRCCSFCCLLFRIIASINLQRLKEYLEL